AGPFPFQPSEYAQCRGDNVGLRDEVWTRRFSGWRIVPRHGNGPDPRDEPSANIEVFIALPIHGHLKASANRRAGLQTQDPERGIDSALPDAAASRLRGQVALGYFHTPPYLLERAAGPMQFQTIGV